MSKIISYHIGIWNLNFVIWFVDFRHTQVILPDTNFTKGLWAKKLNVMKIISAPIFIIMIQSCHKSSQAVALACTKVWYDLIIIFSSDSKTIFYKISHKPFRKWTRTLTVNHWRWNKCCEELPYTNNTVPHTINTCLNIKKQNGYYWTNSIKDCDDIIT